MPLHLSRVFYKECNPEDKCRIYTHVNLMIQDLLCSSTVLIYNLASGMFLSCRSIFQAFVSFELCQLLYF